MKYIIGVDGGGTKTAYLLSDLDGNVTASYIGSTIHYLQIGYDGLANELSKSLDCLLKDTGIAKSDIAFCFLGVAGYGDIIDHQEALDNALSKGLDGIPFKAANDSTSALSGALAGKSGIIVIAGTGSIGLGRTDDGQQCKSGGWHHAFGGDEGSGHWIAEQYIQEFTKQSDYRHPRSELYEYMKKTHQFSDDSEVMSRFVVEWDYDRTKIASLSKDVYELAKRNDPYAIQIFKDAAKELSEIVIAIEKQLQFNHVIELSYIGGAFNAGDYILEPLRDYLEGLSINMHAPLFAPEYGSLFECYNELGLEITESIYHKFQLHQKNG